MKIVRLRELRSDDTAVSQVVGVMLVVAMTVILAAVIGSFVMGLGNEGTQTTPQVTFTFDFDEDGGSGSGADDFGVPVSNGDGNLTIRHQSGSELVARNIAVRGSTPSGGDWADSNPYGSGSTIAAGDTLVVRIDSGDTVRITWTSTDGDDTAELAKYSAP